MTLPDQRFASLVFLLAMLVVLCAAVLLSGCAAPVSGKYSAAAGKLTANLDSARAQIAPVLAHSQGEDKGHLLDADASLKSAQKQAPVLEQAVTDDAATHAALKAEQNHWLGYKARHAILTVVLVGVGVLALMVVLFALMALEPPVGMVASALFHVMTLGTAKLGSVLRGIVASWAQKRIAAKAAQSVPSAAPAVPSITIYPPPLPGSPQAPIVGPTA